MDKKNGIIIVHVPQNGDEFRRVLFFSPIIHRNYTNSLHDSLV